MFYPSFATMKSKIAVLGCGNIGSSIVEGLLEKDQNVASKIYVTRRNVDTLNHLKEKGVRVTSDNALAVKESEIIIIAVKPYKVLELLEEISAHINESHIIVSVASEVSSEQIETCLKRKNPVFRGMPNTAGSVGESITCISENNATAEQREKVVEIFNAIGETIIIDESLMEAATILGACGIAYVLRFIRAMIQGGIQIGFDSKSAEKIAIQTVKGAAELLISKGTHPEQEIDKVTTPKGCTITGLNEMEHQGFSSALIKGIVRSFEKIEK